MRFSLFAPALVFAFAGSTPAPAAEQPEAQFIVMIEFAQANPEWSLLTFHGGRTLGVKGCAVFSALIVARQAGYAGTVPEFTEELRRLDSFDTRGRMRWERIASFAPLFSERLHLQGQAAFDAARTALQDGSYVTFQLRTPWTREHWVAGVGLAGDDIVIIDPAGGIRRSFQSRYAISHLRGLTVFRRLPIRLAAAQTSNRSE